MPCTANEPSQSIRVTSSIRLTGFVPAHVPRPIRALALDLALAPGWRPCHSGYCPVVVLARAAHAAEPLALATASAPERPEGSVEPGPGLELTAELLRLPAEASGHEGLPGCSAG